MLKTFQIVLAAILFLPCAGHSINFGAYPHADVRTPHFVAEYPALDGAGENSKVLLWKFFEEATEGPLVPHSQSNVDGVDGEGDCVAQAFALGVDILTATEIYMLGENERWVAKASVEMIYAGARVEIGDNKLRGKGGSVGEYAARYLKEYGVLHRIPYDGVDLTGYSAARSRQYRDIGVPDELESLAKEHPVTNYTQMKTFKRACDAIAGGQPVIICSSYAPTVDSNGKAHRDDAGFITLATGGGGVCPKCGKRHGRRPKWYHAWLMVGFDTESDRPGGYVINSHGTAWIDGPRPDGLPEGAFKLSPEQLDIMMSDWGTCYAISAYVGHPGTRVKKLKRHKLYL